MNPHLRNGERLLRQGRAAEAASSIRQALAAEPGDGYAHALLSMALLQARDADGALRAAVEGVRNAPGLAFAHYAHGLALVFLRRLDEAEQAATRAMQLGPNEPQHYGLLAMVASERKQHEKALTWIDRGLAVDPEDPELQNQRAQTLVQLRRTGEAAQVARSAIGQDPNNAHSHANAGWTALHNNQPKQALEHFQESLRLDPGYDWAKLGLAEALKAKNPIYRVFLGAILWIARLNPKVRLGVIIGGYVAYRIGAGVARSNPEVAPFIWPVLILYIAFAWMTWVGMPLFDLMLRTSRYGRHALNKRQKLVSNVLGLLILGVAGAFGAYLWLGHSFFQLVGIQLGLYTLITVGVLQMYHAERYRLLLGGCAALGALMLGSWATAFTGPTQTFQTLLNFYLYGFIGMMWFVALGGGGGRRSGVW